MPPKITFFPRARYWSAISQPPFDLRRKHHRNTNEIGRIVNDDIFYVLIGEVDGYVFGNGRSHYHRSVRRKIENGLSFKFFPTGIYQFKFHLFWFSP